jgi:hypothetical protein
MRLGEHTIAIPGNSEYSVTQLKMMLKEVEDVIGRVITLDEWLAL